MSSPQDIVLVINCGSSSLKYEVYLMPDRKSLGKGQVERIGAEKGSVEQKSDRGTIEIERQFADHQEALEAVMNCLTDEKKGIIEDINAIAGVGHRVVHGGERYSASVVIDEDVLDAIKQNVELAPMHNPANLIGIQEVTKTLPRVPQIAVFDTAFHQTLPPAAYLYALPYEFYTKFHIRRYGFHGTSHRYVAAGALELMKRSAENTNIISCHLGNGASITAIENGKSIDTSMGFTPLEGLIMGTRCGDMDPAIFPYLIDRGYSHIELNNILNHKSGLLGISGISNDVRDLEEAAKAGNKRALEALEAYAYRIRKYIGGYAANLVKVDILVFTGGVGQHGVKMRERICHRLESLGIVMDYKQNAKNGPGKGIISVDFSPTAIAVVPTNEELQIAIDTYNLI